MSLLSGLFSPPLPEKFAAMVMRELSRHGAGPLRFDAGTFAIRIGTSNAKEMLFLGNYYNLFLRAPRKERKDVVLRAVMHWIQRPLEKPKTFAEARALLRPSVRSLAYYDVSNLRLEIEALPDRMAPFQTIGRHLAVGLVLDYPESVSMVLPKDLADWGVTFEQAMEAALSALREQSSPCFTNGEGLFLSAWQDTHDASRLLLTDVVTALPVRGRHVVLAPHRNLVIVTGSENAAGLLAMAAVAEEMFSEPQPISAWPLILEDGVWCDWSVPPDHPAARVLKLLQLRRLRDDYATQGALLKTLMERREDGPFVSAFLATEHQATGTLTSYATWTDEVESLLPEAERICFNRVHRPGNVEDLGRVTWDEAMRVVPDLLQPTDRYPARWHVRGFPTAEQLAQMAKV